jgi:membrane-associated HD superfamily phosphohydrolase
MKSHKVAALSFLAAFIASGLGVAPVLLQSTYAQTTEVTTEQGEDSVKIIVRYIKDQIAERVNDADLDDEDLEDAIQETAEDVADDDDASEDIQDALDDAINRSSGSNATALRSMTVEDVAEAATMEAVVNDLAENNTSVVEDAAMAIMDSIVESIVDPDADLQDLAEDAADEVADIIEDGISDEEVEEALDDLDDQDVIDAIESDEIDLVDEILVIAEGITVHGDDDNGDTNINFEETTEDSVIDRLTALENQLSQQESGNTTQNQTNSSSSGIFQ